MNKTVAIRDKVIELLKSETGFKDIKTKKIDACICHAVDIIFPFDGKKQETYRIVVIPHGQY